MADRLTYRTIPSPRRADDFRDLLDPRAESRPLTVVTDMTIDPVDGSVTMYLAAPGVDNPSLTFKGHDAAMLRGWIEAGFQWWDRRGRRLRKGSLRCAGSRPLPGWGSVPITARPPITRRAGEQLRLSHRGSHVLLSSVGSRRARRQSDSNCTTTFMASTPELIKTAVERFQAEVPALQKLKLVFGLELKAKHDIQLYRVELPGPKISKDLQQDERILVEIDRPQFNELAENGTVRSYRKAYETGHIKATGDSNVKKLIAQVVERHEERARLKKAH